MPAPQFAHVVFRTVEELSDRASALKAELPDPTGVLMGAE